MTPLDTFKEKLRRAEQKLAVLQATEDNSWSNQRDQVDEWIDCLKVEIRTYKSQMREENPDFDTDYHT